MRLYDSLISGDMRSRQGTHIDLGEESHSTADDQLRPSLPAEQQPPSIPRLKQPGNHSLPPHCMLSPTSLLLGTLSLAQQSVNRFPESYQQASQDMLTDTSKSTKSLKTW